MAVKKAEISAEESTEDVVKRLLATGHFASADDVVRRGVLLLDQQEEDLGVIDGMLDDAIKEVEQGLVIDADIVFTELRNRYRQT